MQILFSEQDVDGWFVGIQFPHKDAEGNLIIEDFVIPRIDDPAEVLGMVKNRGEIKISGFVRQMPKMNPIYDRSSCHYANQTGRYVEKIREEIERDHRGKPVFIKMDGTYEHKLSPNRKKEFLTKLKDAENDEEKAAIILEYKGKKMPLVATFPITYVMTNDGWVPKFHLDFEKEISDFVSKTVKEKEESKINNSLKLAKTPEEKLQVLKDNTIILPKLTREEKRASRPEKFKKNNSSIVPVISAERSSTWSYEPKYSTKDKMGKLTKVEWKWKIRRMYERGELTENQISVARKMGYIDAEKVA